MSVTYRQIMVAMDNLAPMHLAESWDNPGLLVGNPDDEISHVLVALDVTMDCVDYAARNKIDLIISHHPVIFNALKSIRTDDYDGRMLQKLLVHHIGVYSAHTNWDSADGGVNDILAEKIGLTNLQGLVPVQEEKLFKIAVYVPPSHVTLVRNALGESGAGFIGRYSHCSFSVPGEGQFLPLSGTHPFIGTPGVLEQTQEVRIETIVPESRLSLVLSAVKLAHPYEEPAIDIYPLVNKGRHYHLGRIGTLPEPETARIFLRKLKRNLGIQILTYAGDEDKVISKVAVCGGSGASFIGAAKKAGAQLYLTGDVKYHEAQEAVKAGLVIADGGHFGTENPSVEILARRLQSTGRERGWDVLWEADNKSRDIFKHC